MIGSLRAVLTGRIDYAGLFPPAALSMADAVANYAAYRDSPDGWALARFVVPVVRLEEFEAAAEPHLHGAPWRLSVLAQASEADVIGAFNARMEGLALADTVESRAASVDDVHALTPLASIATVYVELPVHEDPERLIAAVASRGLRAKIRTGGVTADAFPTPAQVARFLAACARHGVMLKATAGLHHPLRGDYALTYAANTPRGTMFGYLNVFLAASFARQGMAEADLVPLLELRDASALQFSDEGVTWRGQLLSSATLAADRAGFAVSFGSCSFREPLDDLSALPLP
ncbi:MAG: hypothetical protein ACYC7F_09090 [Gemmatimonadaceae bacterium]